LPGESFATAINRRGQIVGLIRPQPEAEPPLDKEQHAILWEAQKMIDLGTFPGASHTVSYAAGINNRGQIVGYAETPSGQRHAALWTRLPRRGGNR
jgi:uncharacterized membrane protein